MTTDQFEALQVQIAQFARRAEQTRYSQVPRQGLDRASFLLLDALEAQPLGVKRLAQALGIDSSTATRQVMPMVDSGMVRRHSDPDDARAVVLTLTPAGRMKLQQVREARRSYFAAVTAGWTPDEREEFTRLLARLNTTMARRRADGGTPVPA